MNTSKTALKAQAFFFASLYLLPVGLAALMWLADGQDRPSLLGSNILSVRYTVSSIIMLLLNWPIFHFAKKRKPGTPLTWGEAMVASVWVFFVLVWAYGILPHEFLTWADSELAWRPDVFVLGKGSVWASWWPFLDRFPMRISKQAIRDIVAVLIYGVGLGGFIWFFAFWNDREKKAAEAAGKQVTSAYGRPLVAKAKG